MQTVAVLPDFGMNISATDSSAQNVNGIDRQPSMEPSVNILFETEEKLASRTVRLMGTNKYLFF